MNGVAHRAMKNLRDHHEGHDSKSPRERATDFGTSGADRDLQVDAGNTDTRRT
jgi:hypothetical protein